MKVLLFAALVIASLYLASADDNAAWERYKAEHHLQLSGAEDAEGKANFLATLKRIEDSKHQGLTRSSGVHIGQKINENSHISAEKFAHGAQGSIEPTVENPNVRQIKIAAGSKPVSMSYSPTSYTFPTLPNPLPTSFDWRDYPGIVQPVGNQNPCGCCYVFAGIAALEGQLALRYNKIAKLSEEHVRDCVWTPTYTATAKDSCKGGASMNVWQFAGTTGIMQNGTYPFHRDNTTYSCPAASGTLTNVNVTGLASASGETAIQQALLSVGPLAAAMDAGELASAYNSWDGKSPAVYSGVNCATDKTTHAITLVGWGQDDTNGKYWIFKNSWGATWGDNGFFKMRRGTNACTSEKAVMWPCIDGTCFPANNPALAKLQG